jgi:hypothetical protein
VPRPESIMIDPVLNAARTIPAKVLPGLSDLAPAIQIIGVGSTNLSLSAISLILKSALVGLWTLISFAGYPPGIIISCRVQDSSSLSFF